MLTILGENATLSDFLTPIEMRAVASCERVRGAQRRRPHWRLPESGLGGKAPFSNRMDGLASL